MPAGLPIRLSSIGSNDMAIPMRHPILVSLLLFAVGATGYCRSFEFRYALAMERGGAAIPVNPLAGFAAGDRLRVRVLAGQDSYCYLAVGRSDDFFELLPGRGVAAGGWIELPDLGWLRFDHRPGVEMLYLILASRPVREIEDLRAAGRFPESALLRIRTRYQTGVTSERVHTGEVVRVRLKVGDDRPFVTLEPIRLRHR